MKANGDNPISYESYLQQIAGRGRTMLLPALLAAQARYGHISPEVAGAIGAALRVPLADITGVIEFYSMLYDRPTAETIIRVCTSPTCSSQGAQVLLKELDQSLAVTPGHATPDGKIYLEKTECLGLCDQAPSALADQTAVGRANSARIELESGVHWPCPTADHPGTPTLFADSFPRGKGRLTPLTYNPGAELADEEFPYVLSTGRVLYHWHGGTLTRRSKLDDIYPEPTVEIHPDDAREVGVAAGDWIWVRSRRGKIRVKALITERSPRGLVFIPFHFAEAAANELTLDARDPLAKIPDYKVCAIALDPL